MQQVFVSLSAYGAWEAKRHGQAAFARIALEAGADGVEVRGELLTEPESELAELRALCRGAQLVYSSPEGLWHPAGAFDEAAAARAIDAASRLGARRVKMAIGAFEAGRSQVDALGCFAREGIELVIENDQSPQAGTLDAIEAFFEAASVEATAPGLTFDIGNWHWTGECPLRAAEAFRERVVYVHCKGVQRRADKWVAVPIGDSQAPWRAILRALPRGLPWAIEYPLAGEDLVDVTRREIAVLRSASEGFRR